MLDSQCESHIEHKSSTDVARLSVSPRRAGLFLERLANFDFASADKERLWRFAKAFSDLLPKHGTESLFDRIPRLAEEGFREEWGVSVGFLDRVQRQLRDIWREPAPLLKESGLMMLAGTYMRDCQPQWEPETMGLAYLLTIQDNFLPVLLYALKHVHLMRYCLNSDCKEPYFMARRASQNFCSPTCAKPAQKEAKLRWWRAHGEATRRKRLNKKKRGKNAKAKKA